MALSYSPSAKDDEKALVGQMTGSPLTIDQSRLHVTLRLQPPRNLHGDPADGIEYYYCRNKDCNALWAMQWSPQPRKGVGGCIGLNSYKQIAIPSFCRLCREATKYKGVVEEGAWVAANHEAKQQRTLFGKLKKGIQGGKSKMMSTAGFEDIPLSDPVEGKDETLAKDSSWDLIEESDANEEWSVINHFGCAAIEHRDAHVDTVVVRP